MITINNLNKTYHLKSGDVEAIKDVSLKIEAGEIFGIIGYSGAGKSSLVRCINLLEKPDSGEVIVDGIKLTYMVPDEKEGIRMHTINNRELRKVRTNIGMIFQHFNLLDRSTVFDNIAYPLKYSKKSKEEIEKRVDELLELVDLKDKKYVYPSQLSGGQKQRVAIARALANNPKILLSDEATSALDPEATESILDLLKKLNKKLGITIVIITHEMSVIKTICHKVAVMENGSVVEQGDVYDIFAYPKMQITKKFINSTSSLTKIGTLIKNDPSLANKENGRLVKLLFGKEAVGDALISDVSRKFSVDISIVLASVEVLQDAQLGAMIALIKGTKENIDDAIKYIISNNVVVSDVEIPGGATNE